MKNKKADMSMETVIKAALLLIVLFVIVGSIIYGLFVNKQIPFIGGQIEQTTQDCDEDDSKGISDPCPCDPGVKNKEEKEDKKGKCSEPSSDAQTNCPTLCKK